MNWKEKWEEFKESVMHHEKGEEERKAMTEEMGREPKKVDESTGSETLDD